MKKTINNKLSFIDYILTILVLITIILLTWIFFYEAWRMYQNHKNPPHVFTSFLAIPSAKLSKYEINALFPNIENDWKFIQSLVDTKNLRMPDIYYQTNDNDNDLISDGTYYAETNIINIDHSIFSPEKRIAYKKYVILHELYHAVSYLTKDYNTKEDNHCYMAKNMIFYKIGVYIKDIELGLKEQEKYTKFCINKTKNRQQ